MNVLFYRTMERSHKAPRRRSTVPSRTLELTCFMASMRWLIECVSASSESAAASRSLSRPDSRLASSSTLNTVTDITTAARACRRDDETKERRGRRGRRRRSHRPGRQLFAFANAVCYRFRMRDKDDTNDTDCAISRCH